MNSIERVVMRSAGGPWSLGSGGAAGKGPSGPPAAAGPGQTQVQLTRHEKRTFSGQTIHLAGNAFVDCIFDGCTMVLTNTPFVFSGACRLQRCNWRIEFDLLWGAPATRAQLRQILDSMDNASDAPAAT